jgi:transcriptional regulator with XRE-family HTH domain
MKTGLGRFVAARRKQLGMTQETLAREMGARDRAYVGRIESGDIRLPNAGVRAALAKALQVRTIDLMAAAGEIDPTEISGTTNFPLSERVSDVAASLDALTNEQLEMLRVIVQQMRAHQNGPPPDRGARRPRQSQRV